MPDRSVAYIVAYAKQVMSTIFPHANLKKKTAEKWKKKVLALEATREAEEQLALQAAPPEELTDAQKYEKRTRNHDAILVADKQEDFQKQIGKGSNRRILPSSILIGLASLLWVVSQSGVPMNSAVALPLMVGFIQKAGTLTTPKDFKHTV